MTSEHRIYREKHPLANLHNPVKAKLSEGLVSPGMFLLTGSTIAAEICSIFALDWVLVDVEASPTTDETTADIFRALTGTGTLPLIRVRDKSRAGIEHALDLGARGVLVPKIESADEARQIVDACFYPPQGTRGINPVRASAYFSNVPSYLEHANECTLCMVQIETKCGIENASEIAAVPGIDLLFVGPGDLASALGQPGNVEGPEMERARRYIVEVCTKSGKHAGIFAYSGELAAQHLTEGFTFVALGNDVKFLGESIASALREFTELEGA